MGTSYPLTFVVFTRALPDESVVSLVPSASPPVV